MGAGIITTNAPAIAARIRELIIVLDGWLAELEACLGEAGTERALTTVGRELVLR